MNHHWLNNIMRYVLSKRMRRVRYFSEHPHDVQSAMLSQFVNTARHTEWGRIHDFKNIKTAQQFSKNIPIQDYESLKPYINRMMHGEQDVLWNGQVKWYSKSSGTTNDKSKFIPVTISNLKTCHLKGGWDTSSLIYNARPDTQGSLRPSVRVVRSARLWSNRSRAGWAPAPVALRPRSRQLSGRPMHQR